MTLEPASPVTGEQLRASVHAKDLDGKEIRVLYLWQIDGQAVQESEESVLNSPLHRGAFVEVAVIASNHSASGSPVTVSTLVGNASPAIRFAGQSLGGRNTYQASIEATDPEGDQVEFVLKAGPPGMKIDSATGVIEWLINVEGTGASHEVQIAARDSEGAETLLTYQLKPCMESSDGTVNRASDAASSN